MLRDFFTAFLFFISFYRYVLIVFTPIFSAYCFFFLFIHTLHPLIFEDIFDQEGCFLDLFSTK